MIKAGIIGSTGYAGGELVRILTGHKDVEIKWFGSRSYIDKKYADVYRNMFQIVDAVCLDDNMEQLADQVDVIFTATPQGLCASLVNEEILNKFNEVCSMLKKSGVTIDIVDLPYLENSVSLYQIIALGELSSNLARFDGIKYGYSSLNASCMEEVYTKTRSEGFGEEVKRRIMVGSYLLSGVNARKYYEKALKIRKSIDNSFKNIFSSYDLIIGPTTTSYAYDLNSNNNDALKSFYDDILTNPVNMTGNPALSMPIGFSANNLPIGLQIIGNKYDEKTIYKLASYIEKELDLNLIPGGFYEK